MAYSSVDRFVWSQIINQIRRFSSTPNTRFSYSSFLIGGLFSALLAFTNAKAALTDTLYVTDGDAARLAIINGTTATFKTTHSGGYPLAVRDTIWIGVYDGSGIAKEYDLNGDSTGNTSAIAAIEMLDGAAHGNTNYALGNVRQGNSTATVYGTDQNWSNPTPLFSVSGFDLFGIA